MSKTQSKTLSSSDAESGQDDGVMIVLGKPMSLKDLSLPRGAKVAIVSTSGVDLQKFRKRHKQLASYEVRYFSKTHKTKLPIVNKAAFEPDARALAVLEGIKIAQEDLRRSGGAYDLEQVRTLLRGVSRQAIDKRVHEGSLLAVPGPSNHRSYPTLQFNADGTVVEGLKAVHEALPTDNPWTVLNFLARPDDRLNGRKPIDLLREGKVDRVVEAARRLAEQGA